MSSSLLASDFGKHLKTIIIHLIKNDGLQWDALPEDEKRARVETVYEQFGPGSPVAAHFDAYPYPFSRQKYAEFRAALDAYRNSFR